MKTLLNDQNETGVYAPRYYSVFTCIADKCRHNCCIDWEIGIDEITYAKYKQMEHILDTVKECEDGPCFALKEDGRCPHLNDDGLCHIILSHGEDFLSDICRNHPRFYHEIKSGRTEVGLGIVCEEACRLILESEEPFSLSKVEELCEDDSDDFEIDFDPIPQRDHIISVIELSERSFDETLIALKKEFDIPERYSPDEWLERFLSLEILDAVWERDLQAMKGKLFRKNREGFCQYGKYYARLLIYFVYRHVSTAVSADDLRARLGFAMLSVETIRSLFEEDQKKENVSDFERLVDFARRYSAEIEYSEDNTEELIFAFDVHSD